MNRKFSGWAEWNRDELEKAVEVLLASSIWLSDVPPGTAVPDWVISEVPLTRDRVSKAWDLLNLPPTTPKMTAPLRYKKSKPDQPGIWAWRFDTSSNLTPVKVVSLSQDDCANASCNGIEWCYLGPIPAILPPLKKVTQRLWLERTNVSIALTGSATFFEHWLSDDAEADSSWIRTDTVREITE